MALDGTGAYLRGLGSQAEAFDYRRSALALVEHLGEPAEQATAHDGLADTYVELGDAKPHVPVSGADFDISQDGYARSRPDPPCASQVLEAIRTLVR